MLTNIKTIERKGEARYLELFSLGARGYYLFTRNNTTSIQRKLTTRTGRSTSTKFRPSRRQPSNKMDGTSKFGRSGAALTSLR